MAVALLFMRILKVIARVAVSYLVCPNDSSYVIENEVTTEGSHKFVLRRCSLLSSIVLDDDGKTLLWLFAQRLIGEEITQEVRSDYFSAVLRRTAPLRLLVGEYGGVRSMEAISKIIMIDAGVSSGAACSGNIPVLRWLKSNGYPFSDDLLYLAAWCDQNATFRWLREEGKRGLIWNSDATFAAANRCNLELLKYTWEQKGPWSRDIGAISLQKDFESFKWQVGAGCPIPAINKCDTVHSHRDVVERDRRLVWLKQNNLCDCGGRFH